ncbi:hypothetical protein Ple7327_0151 [Pleurocapsa sp. PCC 7327]|uniref:hypothetical protein n=1 Tax=Pleurocapsa sp. PCC 7327 TaxID=118163 RepID=UPI00029FB183|nr:hypothetical protein [Pleurocapsa sp. PCC 7327]AFY75631.1 hypothetical protein Ple7327_0151 [Pleurocapsa sp. PCC 7327]
MLQIVFGSRSLYVYPHSASSTQNGIRRHAPVKIDKTRENINNQEVLTVLNPNHENFDFDLWATAVRFQMLAALQQGLNANSPNPVAD